MRRIGLPLALVALAAAACTAPAAPPAGTLALSPAAEPPVVPVVALGEAAPGEPPPEDPVTEVVTPLMSEEVPLPARELPADPSPGDVEAALAELGGALVDEAPAPTGEAGEVEIGPEDDGIGAPAAAFQVLAARSPQRRGLGAADPATFKQLARAYPQVLAGMKIVGARDLRRYSLQALPARVDLRALMPPVRDQGGRGLCAYFATVGVLDHLYAGGPAGAIRQASPQQMYWLYHAYAVAQMFRDNLWRDCGAIPPVLYRQLRPEGSPQLPVSPPRTGYVAEADCKYMPWLAGDTPSADPLAMALKHLQKPLFDRIKAGQAVPSQGVNFLAVATDPTTIRTALAAGRPVTLAMPVNWQDWSPRAPYWRVGDYNRTKSLAGWHQIVLVGYELDPAAPGGGWFLFRNSWSSGWADRGHARFSFRSVQDWGIYVFTPERALAPFTTRFDLKPSATKPTPRPTTPPPPTPVPTRTPAPLPSGEPVPDTWFWSSPSHITVNGDWYHEIWRAYEPVTKPEFGYSVWRNPVGNWTPVAGSGGKTGTFPLPARMKVLDGTQYRIQMRGRDARGVMKYSPMNGMLGGMWGAPSPVPSPVRTPTPVPTTTPVPQPSASGTWMENQDFWPLFYVEGGEYWISYSLSATNYLREPMWGYAEPPTHTEKPTITNWVALSGSDIHSNHGRFRLPYFMTRYDGRYYRIQVRGKDDQGRLQHSVMIGLQGGSFRLR